MDADNDQLLALAVAGDRAALGRLLVQHDVRLRRAVSAWITPRLSVLLTVDDVLQEAYAEAYRHIRSFDPNGDDAFHAWLLTIARRRLANLRRWLLATKRGAKRRAREPAADQSSYVELIRLVAGDDPTPSRIARRRETERALRIALDGLKDEYRQVLWARFIEGRSPAEIAARSGKTEGAIHMLCSRALAALRKALGDESEFFSRVR
jgi:RNA polymerase sigma-70 factor (subfamily 1)